MAEDAVNAAPHVYEVVLDTRMKPRDKTEMHSHPALVAYPTTTGKYRFTGPDGHSMEIEVQPGQRPMYMDASEHATENVGTTEGHVLLIEL